MVLVLPCHVSQRVNRVEVIDLLFLVQYALLLVDQYKKWFPEICFCSLISCFYQYHGWTNIIKSTTCTVHTISRLHMQVCLTVSIGNYWERKAADNSCGVLSSIISSGNISLSRRAVAVSSLVVLEFFHFSLPCCIGPCLHHHLIFWYSDLLNSCSQNLCVFWNCHLLIEYLTWAGSFPHSIKVP